MECGFYSFEWQRRALMSSCWPEPEKMSVPESLYNGNWQANLVSLFDALAFSFDVLSATLLPKSPYVCCTDPLTQHQPWECGPCQVSQEGLGWGDKWRRASTSHRTSTEHNGHSSVVAMHALASDDGRSVAWAFNEDVIRHGLNLARIKVLE